MVIRTPKEIASDLSVHIRTVLKWIRDGDLKCFKIGARSYRITDEQLREFLERKAGER